MFIVLFWGSLITNLTLEFQNSKWRTQYSGHPPGQTRLIAGKRLQLILEYRYEGICSCLLQI